MNKNKESSIKGDAISLYILCVVEIKNTQSVRCGLHYCGWDDLLNKHTPEKCSDADQADKSDKYMSNLMWRTC